MQNVAANRLQRALIDAEGVLFNRIMSRQMANNRSKRRIWTINSNVTTVMSVSLVLLLLGMVALLGVAAHRLTNQLKENIGFDVVLSQTASEGEITALKQMWTSARYMSSVKYVSREEALREWERETGEDLMEVIGVNPLSAEFEVNVKPEYACTDSLNRIEYELKKMPGIESIQMHKDVVDVINSNIRNVAMVLLAVAVVLIIISIALIVNTVRLTVYSRRFLIYTMKLVGAKPGFIRKPIVVTNLINGIVSWVISASLLSATLYYLVQFEAGWAELIDITEVSIVFGALLVAGMAICSVAAAVAANRFISLDYDELFTR